jgi:hypothetical protein
MMGGRRSGSGRRCLSNHPEEGPMPPRRARPRCGRFVDRYITFGSLHRAEIRPVHTRFVGERFLGETTLGSESPHVLGENVPQSPFVRPLHGRDWGLLTPLRRPLLSHILFVRHSSVFRFGNQGS